MEVSGFGPYQKTPSWEYARQGEYMEKITKRDYFAIRILPKLMDRTNEPGYDDRGAIYESYKLADLMINLSGLITDRDIELGDKT